MELGVADISGTYYFLQYVMRLDVIKCPLYTDYLRMITNEILLD